MGEEELNLPYKIPNNICRCSSLREVELRPSTYFEGRLDLMTRFQRLSIEEEK